MASLDLSDKRFGRLTALHREGGTIDRSIAWLCRCDCGALVVASASKLNTGRKRSCGCLPREIASMTKATHGHKRGGKISKTYNAWTAMIDRCINPGNARWADYGGRGISVCARWRNSFEAFLEDMGKAPVGSSLERIDNQGDYEKANCRWATARDQARNRRSNRVIEHDGESMTLVEWSERTGISSGTISERLKRGWSVERALTAEVQRGH